MCHGLVQKQDQRSLEVHLPVHEGEHSEWVLTSDRPTLGTNPKSLVGFSDQRPSFGGGEINCVEADSPNISHSNFMRGGSCGEVVEEENVGKPTDCNLSQKQQAYYQAATGISTHGGVQSAFHGQSFGDRSLGILFDTYAGEGLIGGDAQEDGMEFEGGGETLTSI